MSRMFKGCFFNASQPHTVDSCYNAPYGNDQKGVLQPNSVITGLILHVFLLLLGPEIMSVLSGTVLYLGAL